MLPVTLETAPCPCRGLGSYSEVVIPFETSQTRYHRLARSESNDIEYMYMEEKKRRKGGRIPKNNKRTHCVMVRFDDTEWARFLTLYEQSGVYAKAVFVKSRVFGEPFKVIKVDHNTIQFCEQLSSFHAQFRGVAVNYNQVVKELRSHFSEKKAMALLYRLESMTRQMMEQGQQIVALAKEAKEKWLQR